MNVSLTPDLDRFVAEQVRSGEYNSHSEVVRAGLRLLLQQKRETEARLARLRGEIEEGLAEARRGELVDGEEALERLLGRSRAAGESV
nr:hypothetical protein [uncultured bacterium]